MTCCRTCRAARAASPGAGGRPSRRPHDGLDQLVDGTNAALEALRELTRGVFPTQLARAGLEPALRSCLARGGLAGDLRRRPSRPGGGSPPRVEAAVYFCCAEAVARAGRPPTSSS